MKWGQKTVDREDHTVDQAIEINLASKQLDRIEKKLDLLIGDNDTRTEDEKNQQARSVLDNPPTIGKLHLDGSGWVE
tara:strand:- start:21 stop:251 length:231 start_codon:yes stop_codon:yes gene_type:complete